MASSVKNQFKLKSVKAKNKNVKYKLTYKKTYVNSNNNGNLSYALSKSTTLTYKGN